MDEIRDALRRLLGDRDAPPIWRGRALAAIEAWPAQQAGARDLVTADELRRRLITDGRPSACALLAEIHGGEHHEWRADALDLLDGPALDADDEA